jgi:hypothetical protein
MARALRKATRRPSALCRKLASILSTREKQRASLNSEGGHLHDADPETHQFKRNLGQINPAPASC